MNRSTIYPPGVNRFVRVAAWLNLIGNVTIIATGGTVRLTASGLGCPTWPQCTTASWVPTSELSWHSLIEFGNRMMSPVLGILALLLVISVWRGRETRPDLWRLALIVLGGIVAQAVVGGITVITKLNAWIVGFHFLASLALVGVTTALLWRSHLDPGEGRSPAVGKPATVLAHCTSLVLLIVVLLGVVTTANGPHSGDADVVRDSAEWSTLVQFHAIASYALVAFTLLLFAVTIRATYRPLRVAVLALLGVEIAQIAVGIVQARIGIPPLLVGIHMVLAALSIIAMTAAVLALKAPTGAPRTTTDQQPQRETAG